MTDTSISARIEEVTRDAMGRLTVRVSGRTEPVHDARVARCFPWSLPGRHIAVLDKDGKELALLPSLDDLDGASRAVIEEELYDRVFHPRILRVLDHQRDFGVTSIRAETDRGPVTFQICSREDIHALSPTRAVFRDADGNAYEVADLDALDARSRRWIGDYF